MTDREKVIKGLEDIREDYENMRCKVSMEIIDDALALLKAQEPVKPILKREGWNKYYNNYVCPVCDQELVYEQNYCSECGRAVKWK